MKLARATRTSHKILCINTVAFTVCFSAWMLNGVLVTFLSSNRLVDWGPVALGWLMGIPVLTGSVFRLPAGMLTDKFGGKPIYTSLLILCAVPMWCLSYANSFLSFALCSFGFGLVGTSFSIGIASTSAWYPREQQGTALGIFGMGNAGAAITTLGVPHLLDRCTAHGAQFEGWRLVPKFYAVMLVATGLVMLILMDHKKPLASGRTWVNSLAPLQNIRVWRFGLHYFLVFGCFVALSQWLVPYAVNVYSLSLMAAGVLASSFSLPSGVVRAVGGWMSDRWGPRRVMYWVLGLSTAICAMLIIPPMELFSPGHGIMSIQDGVVTAVSATSIRVDDRDYPLLTRPAVVQEGQTRLTVFPTKGVWQEPVVKVGQHVQRRELLAKGVTHVRIQANVWVFGGLVILLGVIWGVGKAAVYKYIPDYFPDEVGVVGGMVGVLGGLGGFVCPIVFGYLLRGTGLWTSCWLFMCLISAICLMWMHRVVVGMTSMAPLTSAHRADECHTGRLTPAIIRGEDDRAGAD